MFLKAVEKNIGGAAKIMGESSFTAAVANIGASISRIGANFLDAGEQGGGFFSQVKPLLAELNEELGLVEDKAADLGVKFGKTFTNVVNKVKELKANFESLPQSIQKAAGFGAVFAVGLGPSLQVVGEGMETFSKVSGGINKAFSSLGSTAKNLPNTFKTIGKGIGNVVGDFRGLGNGLKNMSASYKPAIEGFKLLKSAFNGETGGLERLKYGFVNFGQSVQVFQNGSASVKTSLSSMLKNVVSFAPTFAKGMSIATGIGVLVAGMGLLQQNFGTQIDGFLLQVQQKGPELITNFCNGIVTALPELMTQGSTLITTLLNTITALLPSIISGGMSIISALVIGLAQNLPTLIPAALDMIITLVTGLLNNLPQLIDSGLQLLVGIVEGIVNSLPLLVAAIPDIISSIVITIGQNLPTILQTGIKLLIMIINGILQAIPDLIAALPQIISTIQDAFADTDWLQIGKDLLNSIIDGIKSVLSHLWNTITDIASGIAERLGFNVSGKAESTGSSIPQNAHGTDYWSGGLTYMNEGGRGELVSLPSGSQIIPHDISVKYAKEVARSNTASGYMDISGIGDYIVAAVVDASRLYAEKIEKGISGMRMTAKDREVGRFIADLGFVRR